MSRTTIAPVLWALLDDLGVIAHGKNRPGDVQVIRLAKAELSAMRAVASAAERVEIVEAAIFLSHGGPSRPDLDAEQLRRHRALRSALARLRSLSSPPSRPRKAKR